jgi:hypothetical protein
MIDITKQYTTAFNDEVKLYEIIDDAVFGRIKIANNYHPIRWTIDGINGNPDYNLIPLPEFQITEINNKTVNYFGQELSVPIYAKYIATDKNGDIYAHSADKPILSNGNFNSDWFTFIITCKFNGDWTQSIVEI